MGVSGMVVVVVVVVVGGGGGGNRIKKATLCRASMG